MRALLYIVCLIAFLVTLAVVQSSDLDSAPTRPDILGEAAHCTKQNGGAN